MSHDDITVQTTNEEYDLVNAFEQIVKDKIILMWDNFDEVCKCEKCFKDICAIVLNKLPCQYITSKHGELITQATQLDFATSTQMTIHIARAIQIVGKHPKHLSNK